MELTPATLTLIGAAFALAGMVKGMIGMGLPTVAMSVLGLSLGPTQAVALLALPTLVTNTWQLLAGPGFVPLLRRFATLILGCTVGAFYGASLLAHGSLAGAILGAVLTAYGIFGLVAPKLHVPDRLEQPLAPFVGLASGLLYGSTGLGVIPLIPFLSSLQLEKDALIQAFGLTFSACAIGLTFGLAAEHRMELTVTSTSLFALLPALAGMALGQRLRDRMRQETFRRLFLAWMVIIGLYMLIHACL
jgi:uncharacterized membrane protein YfcA